MNEIWADISGYEGKYQVSNLGKVKSLNYSHTGKEKILKYKKNRYGYLTVNLCSNGKLKMFSIHRLVAQSFIPNTNNLPEVNHKDENKENNCVENLEWSTRKYNLCYGTRTERISKALSKKVGCYKDGKLIKIYNSMRDTEKDGFNPSNVCQCCQGKRYKTHAGYQWRYIDD